MASNDETLKPSTSTSDDQANDETRAGNEQSSSVAATTSSANDNAGAVEVAEDKPAEEYIRLRVITSDMTNEVHFRVKSATALGRLKRSYCSKLGFQLGELRFVFDGHRITDDDTPKTLGMIDDDVIEIYQERTGGGI